MDTDFLIVGAGVSGLALGAELAAVGATLVLEAESMPGTHATGRSAALWTPNFGPPVVRALNRAGGEFLAHPPDGFADAALLSPRGALSVAAPGAEGALDEVVAAGRAAHPVHRIGAAEALALAPLLRPERVAAAAFEPGVADIDVDALQRGFLVRLRERGGRLACDAPVARCERVAGGWRVEAGGASLVARTLVNAAGAWADGLAALAGARPVGLVPKRRTAIVVDAPPGLELSGMPLVDFAGTHAYCKPDAGRLLASPGDETPTHAHDVRPDEMDVALMVERLETETFVDVRTAPRAWAGLRTFAPDGLPVVGFDPGAPGFFWLAGQGGYGIMMAEPLARLAAGLIVGGGVPGNLAAAGGVDVGALAPRRFGT